MGFRFRKSVKIAPGIKLNLSKSGGSLSIGGRGATVNISSRGVRSTYSIPGTGLSYVTQTSSNRSQKYNDQNLSNRSAYKELLRQQKEQEKQKLLQEAEESYSAFQAKIESLANILREREKQTFNWEEVTARREEYEPVIYTYPKFIEPDKNFSEVTIKREIKSKNSRLYITYFLSGLGFVIFFQNVWISFLLFALAVASYISEQNRLVKLYNQSLPIRIQEETEKYNQSKQKAHEEYLKRVGLEEAEHIKIEEENKKTWDEEERGRERLKNAVKLEDPEPLAELLEIELSNEELPVPLVFDIEFIDVNTVNIFMELPDLDVVPEEKMSLTKTCKLSTRKMAQKDRFKLYSDICTGLTLRLIYETFRVIYSVNTVEFFGLTEKINPANGTAENITSLYIKISRIDFEKLNLDVLDPTLAFTSLNGEFACSKKGELFPIKGS